MTSLLHFGNSVHKSTFLISCVAIREAVAMEVSQPPRFTGNSLDLSWLAETLGANSTDTITCNTLDDVGGMISQLFKITWTTCTSGENATKRFVFKQITTDAKKLTSAVLGYAREVEFYRDELSQEIATQLLGEDKPRLIPMCVYAHANKVTGEKYLMMEDLGKGEQHQSFLTSRNSVRIFLWPWEPQ